MGYRDWASAETITEAKIQELMDQGAMVFSSATDRTNNGPSTPTEGMVSYLTDTDGIYYYSGTAWVPILVKLSYSPALSGWTLSDGSISGEAWQQGSIVTFWLRYSVGSSDTLSGEPEFSLPSTPTGTDRFDNSIGGYVYDASGPRYPLSGYLASGKLRPMCFTASSTYASQAVCSPTVPISFVVSDRFDMYGQYEVAI